MLPGVRNCRTGCRHTGPASVFSTAAGQPETRSFVVEQVCDAAGQKCHWLIRPDQSLQWHTAVKVYLVIAGVCLAVGVFFALQGYWPVLPFAGLEVAVLGAAFYGCLARSQLREIVSVNADSVTVEKGRREPQQHWEYPRAWARINLERSHIAWYPSRLSVSFRGEAVEIGTFLNEQERCLLAAELQKAVRHSGPAH